MDFAALLEMLNVIAWVILKTCLDENFHFSTLIETAWTKPQLPNHFNLKELSHLFDGSLSLSDRLNDLPIRVYILRLKTQLNHLLLRSGSE